ncbi:phage portal protein [Amycolatopsis sp. NPDC059657]|uniref:phage portal protein n=1 Tax=Amycolatopsis sp. NPDC059657 TaxID=3346899 RepID=UPI00366DAFC9
MKLSDLTPEQWYGRLKDRAEQQREDAVLWWKYMDLEQDLVYVARIIAEQDGRFPPMLMPWSELVIESVVERLRHEAFLSGEQPVDELNQAWQANDLDEASDEAHIAAGVGGLQYVMVGPDGPGGGPMVTTEYADEVAVELDPRTRQPIVGLKRWQEDNFEGGNTERAALYIPTFPTVTDGAFGPCRVYEMNDKGKFEQLPDLGNWSRVIANDRSLPSVPLVPMRSNPRRGRYFSDLKQLQHGLDGANQTMTNMMAGIEHHAVGRKWIVGATAKDFVDENNKPIPLWKVATGDVWGIPHAKSTVRGETAPPIQVGQFSASDLRNFHESYKVLALTVASKYGMPPSYMGYSSENPPSAESILYALERLVLRTEKRQLWYGGAWNRAARIQWAIMEKDPNRIASMESKWRNAATPTLASRIDAAVKAVGGGVIDNEQAWTDIGYSEQTKAGMRKRMADRAADFRRAANDLRNLDVGVGVNPDQPAEPGVTDVPAAVGA